MDKRRRFTALVFDLDGTLVDSVPRMQAVLNRILARAGLPLLRADALKAMVGGRVEEMVDEAVRSVGGFDVGSADAATDWLARYLDEYRSYDATRDQPFPGVPETLTRLRERGFVMAVCTNKRQAPTLDILEKAGLSVFFDAVVGGDVVDGMQKPNPRHLLAALERLNTSPTAALMVGDHPNDLACARSANVPVVLCAYGYSTVPVYQLGADAVINRFADLPAAIAPLA